MPDPTEAEAARLAALRGYRILDTSEDGSFSALTAQMARAFHAPIAAVTFVDEKRQWFKAGHGIGVRETPREWSFAAHAQRQPGPLIIRDARNDIRFARNPMVTGPPHIRFYAGLRLIDPRAQQAIGAVSVCDTKPRPSGLSDALTELLGDFAGRAMAHVELHLFRLEWIEGLSAQLLLDAVKAHRAGLDAEAERFIQLAYAAAEVKDATNEASHPPDGEAESGRGT